MPETKEKNCKHEVLTPIAWASNGDGVWILFDCEGCPETICLRAEYVVNG